ncbi:MAG: hypothetical protein M9955_17210 [Rhizobiaceae bacterium]|nr:hypothetical protein [Rhizobiaceae bacterium]
MIGALLFSKAAALLRWLVMLTIPVPVVVIGAGVVWAKLDKASAVRRAVDEATVELVAGARIKALEATADAERRLRMYAEGKAAAAASANEAFLDKLTIAEREKEGLVDELAELQKRPAPDGCVVTDDLLGRLRK